MPRRRAVRVLGAALVTAAVPGIRAGGALAAASQDPCASGCTGPGESVCGLPWQAGCIKTCTDDLFPVCCKWPGSPPTVQKCMKGQTCGEHPGDCVWRCKPGERECNGKCCKSGEVCKNGKCCSSARVCGDTCCPAGQKCTFVKKKRTCCPTNRIVSKGGNRFCCPKGTVSIKGEACCPPSNRGCCGHGEDEVPLPALDKRAFCVRGREVKL